MLLGPKVWSLNPGRALFFSDMYELNVFFWENLNCPTNLDCEFLSVTFQCKEFPFLLVNFDCNNPCDFHQNL